MTALMDWVSGVDLGTLYALLALVSFIESIFPPAPADVVVAFGAFLAARRGADYSAVVAAIVTGSTIGAMVIYSVARRFGADWMHAQIKRLHLAGAEEKLEKMYANYGVAALLMSRFLPGLRAVVPPMAGALRVPPVRTAAAIAVASAAWYGIVIWIAFRVGADFDEVRATLHTLGRRLGIVALVVIAGLAYGGWRLYQRHKVQAAQAASDAPAA